MLSLTTVEGTIEKPHKVVVLGPDSTKWNCDPTHNSLSSKGVRSHKSAIADLKDLTQLTNKECCILNRVYPQWKVVLKKVLYIVEDNIFCHPRESGGPVTH